MKCSCLHRACWFIHLSCTPCRHDDSVMAVRFHPSAQRNFVSCGWNGKVRMWCADPPKVVHWRQTQHTLQPLSIHCGAFNARGDKLYVGLQHGRVRQFDIAPDLQLDHHAELGALLCLYNTQ